jgi:hypothetical protein
VTGSLPQVARRRREVGSGARLSRRRNGVRNRFNVSWVGLYWGRIARCTFKRGLSTWAVCSVMPIARMTFARAC